MNLTWMRCLRLWLVVLPLAAALVEQLIANAATETLCPEAARSPIGSAVEEDEHAMLQLGHAKVGSSLSSSAVQNDAATAYLRRDLPSFASEDDVAPSDEMQYLPLVDRVPDSAREDQRQESLMLAGRGDASLAERKRDLHFEDKLEAISRAAEMLGNDAAYVSRAVRDLRGAGHLVEDGTQMLPEAEFYPAKFGDEFGAGLRERAASGLPSHGRMSSVVYPPYDQRFQGPALLDSSRSLATTTNPMETTTVAETTTPEVTDSPWCGQLPHITRCSPLNRLITLKYRTSVYIGCLLWTLTLLVLGMLMAASCCGFRLLHGLLLLIGSLTVFFGGLIYLLR